MGNNLDIYAGTGETANEPVPQLDGQTADRPHDRSLNANEKPLEELASTGASRIEATPPHRLSIPSNRRRRRRQTVHPFWSVGLLIGPSRKMTFVPTAPRPLTIAAMRGRSGPMSGRWRSERSVTGVQKMHMHNGP